ncbi:hypothetical protein MuYL_0834 [Mucilaginibacter xinganensis]|uniref:Uncharacterized protein n=1 Tax=Mucilaginibacter xinganensis TaxID=1234841 RepID=A0A223NST2_9SPHI|nr:hypothetical protein MuYL_0834 [Mucilaginibacter xinganensis]
MWLFIYKIQGILRVFYQNDIFLTLSRVDFKEMTISIKDCRQIKIAGRRDVFALRTPLTFNPA